MGKALKPRINHEPSTVMKNMNLITLGLVLTSATLALGQDTYGVSEPQPLPHPADSSASLARLAEATRVAEKQAEVAGKQARWMLAQAGGGGSTGGYGVPFGMATGPGTSHALIIPKDSSDAKNLGEVQEDMEVMAYILDKAINHGDNTARAMGIRVGRLPSVTAAAQNLYIDGTGAIFLLNVNYPLLPPPSRREKAEAKQPVNSEWEEARSEMAHPDRSSGHPNPFLLFQQRYGGDATWNATFHPAEYDADKVEALKKDLVSALKNAANIRRLKSDETITVVVTGAEGSPVTQVVKSTGSNTTSERVIVTNGQPGEHTQTAAAKLVMRARKADAEAFQNGDLSFDDFRRKVTTILY